MRNFVRTALILSFVVFHLTAAYSMEQLTIPRNPNIGQTASDFTLDVLDKGEVNLKEYRDGKRAIIFFWATWCPHCRTALQELDQRKSDFQDKDIKLVIIDLAESEETVRAYVKAHDIGLDMFLDENDSLSEPYKIIGVPTFFFIDENGIIQDVLHELPPHYEDILNGI